MSNHRLCEEPLVAACSETFRLQASKWIDSTNFGATNIASPPPAGIRLRWNCPFLSADPAQRAGEARTYSVWRSEPLDDDILKDYQPNVGHIPRSGTPIKLWVSFAKVNDRLYTVDSDENCDSLDAVYLEVPNTISSVNVSLVGLDGHTKITGELKGGDKFYFELGGIRQVVFSGDCPLKKIFGLSLSNYDVLDGINFNQIARIDAQCWTDVAFIELGVRLANSAGNSFNSITEEQWEELRIIGSRISEGYQTGDQVAQSDIDALRLATSLYWEVAALVGLGFVDGEHIVGQDLDTISSMLGYADGQNYGYYVVATLENSTGLTETRSSLYFTKASLMNELGEVIARSIVTPVTRSELTNPIIPSEGKGIPDGDAVVQCYCETEWELQATLPDTERIITIPMAQDSQISGEAFIPVGEFYSGSNKKVTEFIGMSYLQRRSHRYRVPYFDADVWLDLVATDSWGRRRQLSPTPALQPDIDYKGRCLPITEGWCQPESREVTITFNGTMKWKADPLAVSADAEINLLIKNPLKQPLAITGHIGPAFPTMDGNWAGEIMNADIDNSQLSRLIDGTMVVSGFSARVISLVPIGAGKLKCIFEAITECAGAALYPAPSGFADVVLYENPHAPGLWWTIGSVDLLGDGSPVSESTVILLTVIEEQYGYVFDHSMTLYFATRLSLSFEGKPFVGPVSVPIAVAYLHPAPKAPEVCFDLQQLGVDYYGRTIVRVVTGKCEQLDPKYKCRLKVSPGSVTESKTFADASAEGLMGAQYATGNHSLWEVFSTLSSFQEGSLFTVGISYHRDSDGAEGLPALDRFEVRKTEE